MNIIICATQVPFVRGGAEIHVEGLRDALLDRGHRAEIVALPFKWYPKDEILKTALCWRLLDLTEANGIPVDLVICTKFPTWAVRHPRKIAWVIHQHRQAYDWFGTPLSDFTNSPEDLAIRRRIVEIDRRGLGECAARFTNSANVAARLKHSTGLDAQPLHVPIRLSGLRPEAFEGYIFSISRLDRAKRVDLLLEGLARAGGESRAVIAGEGPEEPRLRDLAKRLGIDGRVEFAGRLPDDEVVRHYNRARAVYYGPVDEDFGLVTVEAFTARKPVITFADSGGVLELVEDGISGLVVPEPAAELLAVALSWLLADADLARRMGEAGRRRVAGIHWDGVVEMLLAGV
ncbi:glycosyltransferase family 4 protein [Nitrolancea hollandica]|uniref:Glycosyl transferase group 1 n=1 Tax=Nitrolancea hollandica Lb TaxID=1129897 RepID=I4ECD7_9BACT|nr:glycosyltransferase family 4 protein [Nitrolancea hollandica]CCF82349.1 Glycosyl transferase group 1 [Nitrolancea hollandica Lb]